MITDTRPPFITELQLKREKVPGWETYPFTIPVIKSLDKLPFSSNVTFFIGENGSGKSTLLEAIAVASGFNPEGGTKNFNFSTRNSHSDLDNYIRLVKSHRYPKDGFFLRAESFYNVASNIDDLDGDAEASSLSQPLIKASYGGKSLHHQSHGESFLNLAINRFSGEGLYLLDEPESALSPNRQMTLLALMKQLVDKKSQFIIATHSPILLAYPGALIYQITDEEIETTTYEQTEHHRITKAFINNPQKMLAELFDDIG